MVLSKSNPHTVCWEGEGERRRERGREGERIKEKRRERGREGGRSKEKRREGDREEKDKEEEKRI